MAFSLDVFQIIFFVFLLALGSEIALYLWCYQSSSFKSINESIVKQSRKASALKGTPQFYNQKQNKKNDRFEAGLKKDATKELAVLKVKQSVVAAVGAIGMYWILSSLYLDQVVAKLPFDANFWLIAKVAHRGLKFPKPNDCAVTFIYVLCQTGIRMNLQHFLMWGPSRAMQDMTSWQQVTDEAK